MVVCSLLLVKNINLDNITNIDINFFYEFLERILQIYDGKKEILVDTNFTFFANIWRICGSDARNCGSAIYLYNLLNDLYFRYLSILS